MTEALDAMVKAMRDEFSAQVRHCEAARVHERAEGRAHPLDELSGGFDLEKVAQAGLDAVAAAAHVGYRWRKGGFWVTSYASDEVPTAEKQPLYALDEIPGSAAT